MSRFSRYRPSPAMIVACLALFVALGGVGYAAATIGSTQIKNNSVRGKDIRNSTITGKDVKNSGLTGSDVKNSSLAGRDVKNNSLLGADINESSLGKVPASSTADRAGSAANVDKLVTSGSLAKVSAAPAAGNTATVLKKGPFTFTLNCVDAGGGSVQWTLRAESTEANSFVGLLTSSGTAMPTPGTPVTVLTTSSTSPTYIGGIPYGAGAPSGASVNGVFAVVIKNLGADCAVSQYAVG